MSVKTLLLLMSVPLYASTVDLETLLQNPSFEMGPAPVSCPANWTCGGSPAPGFTAYQPTAAQYISGADGLASGIAPDGTWTAESPIIEVSGTLAQTNLGTWAAGTDYMLDLWIGSPLTVFDNGDAPAGEISTMRLYLLGGAGALSDGVIDLTVPITGQWVEDAIDFTPGADDIGQSIGVEIFADSTPQSGGSGNNEVADLDITKDGPASTPEPGTLALIGSGLVSLGFLRKRV